LFGKKALSYQSFIEVNSFPVDKRNLENSMRPHLLTLMTFPATFWSADRRLVSSVFPEDALCFIISLMLMVLYQLLCRLPSQQAEARALAGERNLLESQLREAQALIQILTHDLASPLFVIQSMAELQTEKPQLEPKARQTFEKIRGAAQSAQAILKVVKELEAIEAGKLDLLLKPVPLLATLKATLDILRPQAERKQLTLNLEADIPGNLMVLGERSVLEHTIFHNVVANAIKFSKAGDRIEIRVARSDADQVVTAIRDHGMGIPRKLITQLFSHNCKTSRRGTAGEKGTGLGLPLARRYVQKFGGSIEVESQACEDYPNDHWTEFTVTLKKAG
jgi:signal transduction histidine kinase